MVWRSAFPSVLDNAAKQIAGVGEFRHVLSKVEALSLRGWKQPQSEGEGRDFLQNYATAAVAERWKAKGQVGQQSRFA